jgi:hypothetical protein
MLPLAGCVQPMPRAEAQTAFVRALSVCEVIGNGGNYLGQTVLVRGYYTSNHHFDWITDDPCPDDGYPLGGDPDHPDDPRAARTLKSLYGRDRHRTRIATVFRARVAERERRPGGMCAQPYCDRYYLEAVQLVAVDPQRRMTGGSQVPR